MLHLSDMRVAFSLYLGEDQPRVKIHRIESLGPKEQEPDLRRFKNMLDDVRQQRFSPVKAELAPQWAQNMPRPDKIN